jgi:hypothetical protein
LRPALAAGGFNGGGTTGAGGADGSAAGFGCSSVGVFLETSAAVVPTSGAGSLSVNVDLQLGQLNVRPAGTGCDDFSFALHFGQDTR